MLDINVHEMPASDAVGVVGILARSPGLNIVGLGEATIGGRDGWRFEADVIEDMAYDGRCGETDDAGDHTVVHVVGVDRHTVAFNATAPRGEFSRFVPVLDDVLRSVRFR